MTVETATYISQLDPTKPGINDPKSEGDDHLRLTKAVLQSQFPSLGAAAVTVTAAELNSVPGKAAKAGDTYSGTHDMTGATVNVATQAATDATTKAASTLMVQNAILASSGITATLPGQGGNAGKVLKTDGVSPAWGFSGASLTAGRASNVQLTAADGMTFIDITGGTFTQTFDACASLGAGWWCYLRNSGSGDITLDPNGSETIDGLTGFVMYPGEVRLVMCDGLTLKSIVLASFYKTFTASGTFTTPPGYSQFAGLLWGGGGGGGKGSTYDYGGGGGACVPVTVSTALMPAAVAVVIAAAAIGASASGSGSQGNNSAFGTLLTAYGGAPGGSGGGGGGGSLGAGSGVTGGSPSVPSSTSPSSRDNPGFGGGSGCNSSTSVYSGSSVWGGGGGGGGGSGASSLSPGKSVYGGGGGGGVGTSNAGGVSVYGGAGGVSAASAAGGDGVAPGGGGGGTTTGTKAGDGARGELRIWGVI